MKNIILACLLLSMAASCREPGLITARPDPTTSSSGTLGSVKATNGVLPLTGNGIPADTSRVRKN
jgi:hypothetical protein